MRVFGFIVILMTVWITGFGQSKRGYLRNEGKGTNRNMVYIDYDRHSKYYDLICNFKFSPAQLSTYNKAIKLLKGKNIGPLPKRNLAGLPLKWCPLKVYQAECFAYYPANPANNYRIAFNDTTCIEFSGDKVSVSQLLAVKKKDATYSIVHMGADKKPSTFIIHLVDTYKGRALFENLFPGVQYSLLVPAENLHNFDLIVNYSKNGKAREYEFAPRDILNFAKGL